MPGPRRGKADRFTSRPSARYSWACCRKGACFAETKFRISLPSDGGSLVRGCRARGRGFPGMLAESLPQLVWTCLPDGRVDYLNRQWLDYTGMSEADPLDSQRLKQVIHPDD